MKKIIFVNLSVIAGILSMMLLVSCGGGGSSTSSGGGTVSGATVRGDVTSFNGVAMFDPDSNQSQLAHALQSLSDSVMSSANALAGVTVSIGGYTTVTNSDGEFSVEGVPSGPTLVALTYNGATATITIDIPANAEEVYLDDLTVDGTNIVYSGVRIEIDDGKSSDDGISSSDGKSSDDGISSSDGKSSDDGISSDDSSAQTT